MIDSAHLFRSQRHHRDRGPVAVHELHLVRETWALKDVDDRALGACRQLMIRQIRSRIQPAIFAAH